MRITHSTLTIALWYITRLSSYSVLGMSTISLPNAKTSSTAPGPVKWPIVGTLPDFLMRGGGDALFEVHSSLYEEYGDVYAMSILGDDEAVVCDPREYEAVFRSEGKYPYGASQDARVFIDYHEMRGNDASVKSMRDGDEWRTWRQQLQPDMFSPAAAKSYLPHINQAAIEASKVAKHHEDQFDLFISRLAFDMFCSIMFGQSPGTANAADAEQTDLDFVANARSAFSMAGVIMLSPQERVFKTDKYDKFVNSMDVSMDFARKRTLQFVEIARKMQFEAEEESGKCPVAGAVAATKRVGRILGDVRPGRKYENDDPVDGSASMPPSCVSRLIARGEIPLDELTETVGTLLLAGVDTTAYVLGWLYLNLASNPLVQEKLAAELKNVLGGSDVTDVSLDDLPYLQACIRESHRLTPPGPISGVRRLPQDITMGGHAFPAGTRLSLNINAFQMDPKYVDNPQEFRPERWLKDAVDERKGTDAEVIDHRLLSAPFGSGARMCLGARLAEVEIMSATARLFQDWKMVLDPTDQTWTRKQGLFVKADPFPKFELIPRT